MILLIDMIGMKGKIYAHSYVRNNIFYNPVKYRNPHIKYIERYNINRII